MKSLLSILTFCFCFSGIAIHSYPQNTKPQWPPSENKENNKREKIDSAIAIQVDPGALKASRSDGSEVTVKTLSYVIPSFMEMTDVTIDTTLNELFFLAMRTGRPSSLKPVYLFAYDFKSNHILWLREHPFGKGNYYFPISDLVVFRFRGLNSWDNFAFSKKTGALLWKNDFDFRIPDPNRTIAFSGNLDCIDLLTGKIKWSRKTDNDYGWLEDTIRNENLYSMIDGVHRYNLQDGTGWDFHANSGKKEAAELVGQIIGGAVISSVTGIYISTGTASSRLRRDFPESHAINSSGSVTRTGLASNILFEKDRIYFSAIDRLCCVDDNNGTKIWEIRLPDERTGSAFLDITGDHILFINKGISFKGRNIQSYFIPYLSFLNKTNGKILCTRNITNPLLPALDYLTTDSLAYILNENEILTYNNNCMLKEKSSSSPDSMMRQKTGKFMFFLKGTQLKNMYYQTGSSKNNFKTMPAMKENGAEYFLMTENGIVCLDRNMHQVHWIPSADLVWSLYRFNDRCLLGPLKSYNSKRFLIDEKKEGELVIQFNLPFRSEFNNGYLVYYPTKNSVTVIPLSSFEKIR